MKNKKVEGIELAEGLYEEFWSLLLTCRSAIPILLLVYYSFSVAQIY